MEPSRTERLFHRPHNTFYFTSSTIKPKSWTIGKHWHLSLDQSQNISRIWSKHGRQFLDIITLVSFLPRQHLYLNFTLFLYVFIFWVFVFHVFWNWVCFVSVIFAQQTVVGPGRGGCGAPTWQRKGHHAWGFQAH